MWGPLRTGASGFTHLLVAVDKFTKWIEAKPIKKLDSRTSIKFMKEIVFRYGVPHSIINDNGSNFDSEESGRSVPLKAPESTMHLWRTRSRTDRRR